MKAALKVITALFLLGMAVLVGLHLFLQYGLTKTMRQAVLPRLKAETGIDARVGGLSLNLPKGMLHLSEVAVKNPDGFFLENLASVDRIDVEVDILSLFRNQLVLVRSIAVDNALVNVVRNKQGEININRLQDGLPKPAQPAPMPPPPPEPGKPVPERPPAEPAPGPVESKPLPEVLVQSLQCQARVRYVDFKLRQLDIALDLNVSGSGLSTQKDPATPWGDLAVNGALGNDRTSFVTDLKLRLAPVTDPQSPSFDLTGKVLEIDPRLMDAVYSKLGIRSAPFGLDPQIHCRAGRFQDSSVALNVTDIVFEDKLADRLGGMGSIGSLRFPVPVEGSLQEPQVDFLRATRDAFGGNARGVLDAFLKNAAAKEAGLDKPPENLADAAVAVLGKHVDEIGESESAKKVLKDLAGGKPSGTNASEAVSSDVLVDLLGEQVEEIGENKELKDDLKNLGKRLFGR